MNIQEPQDDQPPASDATPRLLRVRLDTLRQVFTEELLREIFNRFGEVRSLELLRSECRDGSTEIRGEVTLLCYDKAALREVCQEQRIDKERFPIVGVFAEDTEVFLWCQEVRQQKQFSSAIPYDQALGMIEGRPVAEPDGTIVVGGIRFAPEVEQLQLLRRAIGRPGLITYWPDESGLPGCVRRVALWQCFEEYRGPMLFFQGTVVELTNGVLALEIRIRDREQPRNFSTRTIRFPTTGDIPLEVGRRYRTAWVRQGDQWQLKRTRDLPLHEEMKARYPSKRRRPWQRPAQRLRASTEPPAPSAPPETSAPATGLPLLTGPKATISRAERPVTNCRTSAFEHTVVA